MRFRYFDAAGEEVKVSSVDALEFRIGTGAVTRETLLYDGAVDQWAPAHEHAVFRFLTEDDGEVEPSGREDAAAGEGGAAEQPAARMPSESFEAPSEPQSSRSPRLRPGEGNVVLRLDARDESETESDEEHTTPPPPAPDVVRERPRAHDFDLRAPSFPRALVRKVGGGVLLVGAALAAVLVVRNGGETGEAAMAVAGELGGFLASGDEAPSMPRSAPDPVDPTGPATAMASASALAEGSVGIPSDRTLDELAAELAAAATGDLELALLDLKSALAVPDRPPEIWLDGRYLAGADSFPQVRSYWQSVSAFVTAMEELDENLYRGFVESRVLRMRLDTATAASLSAQALERYHRTVEERTLTFDNLNELTGLALRLHDTLEWRSADIAYEPFDSRGLSRDPVVEAVADDPELAQEIWSTLDRIFVLLEDLQGLGPVSTNLLQEAVLEELRPGDD